MTVQSQSISSQFVAWGHCMHAAAIASNTSHGYVCMCWVLTQLGTLYGSEDSAANTKPDRHSKVMPL